MSDGAFLRRKAIRLHSYDYRVAGHYFVTVCTRNRECWLGAVGGGGFRPTPAGDIVAAAWAEVGARLSNVSLDAFVVMPNHVHAIVVLGGTAGEGVMNAAPTRGAPDHEVGAQFIAPSGAPAESQGTGHNAALGDVVRQLKAVAALRIRKAGLTGFAWQRGYFEHVIRDEPGLDRLREYILDNPRRWGEDPENPERVRHLARPAR